jgi:hypothetical protein
VNEVGPDLDACPTWPSKSHQITNTAPPTFIYDRGEVIVRLLLKCETLTMCNKAGRIFRRTG